MTDTTTPATAYDTETVEGIVNLLRERLARGERPTQNGDSFSMFLFMEAMNIVHDEMLDQDTLAQCVAQLKGVLTLQPEASVAGFTKPYVDAAFRVVNREQAEQEEGSATADPV
jgi:hypothetical protein